jgi:hypothetical protein
MEKAWKSGGYSAAVKAIKDYKFNYASDPREQEILALKLVKAGWDLVWDKSIGDFSFKLPMAYEVERWLSVKMPEFSFVGKTDLIGKRQPNRIAIVDWKTTSTVYGTHDIVTSEQLTNYAWLYWKLENVLPECVAFVTLNKKTGGADAYHAKRSLEDVLAWEEKVTFTATRMAAGEQWRNPDACVSRWGKCYHYNLCWSKTGRQTGGNPEALTDF